MPVRLKSILIVNVNSVMTHLMNLIKPFMRKEYVKYVSNISVFHLFVL